MIRRCHIVGLERFRARFWAGLQRNHRKNCPLQPPTAGNLLFTTSAAQEPRLDYPEDSKLFGNDEEIGGGVAVPG